MIWVAVLCLLLGLGLGVWFAGRARREAAPPKPTPPEQAAPTHVMPISEIERRVERKYPGLTRDRQLVIARDIARQAAGLIPGAKPRQAQR